MIYTMAGSLGLLLAIQMLGVVAGTFDIPELYTRWNSLEQVAIWLPDRNGKSVCFLGVHDCVCN